MLNILPSNKKSAIAKVQLYRKIRSACSFAIIIFLLLDVIVIGSRVGLSMWLDRIEQSPRVTTELIEGVDVVTQRLAELGSIITAMNTLTASEVFNPIQHFSIIMNDIPEDVSVQTVGVRYGDADDNTNNNAVSIEGVSTDRTSLTVFQRTLNEHAEFGEFSLPVADLTKREGIPFTLEAGIVTEESEVTNGN